MQSLPEECAAAAEVASFISNKIGILGFTLRRALEDITAKEAAVAAPFVWWPQSAESLLQPIHEESRDRSDIPADASVLEVSCCRYLQDDVSCKSSSCLPSFCQKAEFVSAEVPCASSEAQRWTSKSASKLNIERSSLCKILIGNLDVQVKFGSKADHPIIESVYPVMDALTTLLHNLAIQQEALPYIEV